MNMRTIYVTQFDKVRLISIIEAYRRSNRNTQYLEDLEKELMRAEIVLPEDMPNNVITMNSKVLIRELASGKEVVCELVFPNDADILKNKISILAPVGTALIGYSVGDIIEWKVPAGLKKFEVVEILYQPEAARHFHL